MVLWSGCLSGCELRRDRTTMLQERRGAMRPGAGRQSGQQHTTLLHGGKVAHLETAGLLLRGRRGWPGHHGAAAAETRATLSPGSATPLTRGESSMAPPLGGPQPPLPAAQAVAQAAGPAARWTGGSPAHTPGRGAGAAARAVGAAAAAAAAAGAEAGGAAAAGAGAGG